MERVIVTIILIVMEIFYVVMIIVPMVQQEWIVAQVISTDIFSFQRLTFRLYFLNMF